MKPQCVHLVLLDGRTVAVCLSKKRALKLMQDWKPKFAHCEWSIKRIEVIQE